MPVRRFHVNDLSPDRVALDEADAAHARKVLRLAAGDAVTLLDGRGGRAVGRIEQVADQVIVRIDERQTIQPPAVALHMATAIPKGSRAEVMVEKLSELGVDRLIPLRTDYSVVDPGAGKLRRFERLAEAAAKQCGRVWRMDVVEPTDFTTLISQADPATTWLTDVPAELHDLQGLDPRRAIIDLMRRQRAGAILVLVGPEGGWSDAERQAARDARWGRWSFAEHVLRVETAALAGAALLAEARYQAGRSPENMPEIHDV